MNHLGMDKDSEIEVHIAPMIDISNRYFRSFMRLTSQRVIVWTEMIKDDAIIHNATNPERLEWFLGHDPEEKRCVFQLGGSDPSNLADAADIVAQWGFDEINLNVGCPSKKVCNKGQFGARLMLEPDNVRECIYQMQRRVAHRGVPVTVKTRLGVDEFDTPEFTKNFVDTVAQSGCTRFYMHARKAWLSGLSPAQNRSVPPLNYERVRWLCQERPDLSFVLNGGLQSLAQCKEELRAAPSNMVGVMLGRAAIYHPALFTQVDHEMFGDPKREGFCRGALLKEYIRYLERRIAPVADGEKAGVVNGAGISGAALKPAVNLFADFPGSKKMAQLVEAHVRNPESCRKGPAWMLSDALDVITKRYPAVVAHPFDVPVTNPAMMQQLGARDHGRERHLQYTAAGDASAPTEDACAAEAVAVDGEATCPAADDECASA